ncbi:MAG: ROK family protein [Pseudomonadales bacterium]|nr:ROK family protein [Pseudomonadales bacterium]
MRMGIDLGGTKIEGTVLDDSGSIVWRQRVATPAEDYCAVIDAIDKLVSAMCRDNTLPADLPVGIGTPGTYARAEKVMKNCNSVYLNGRDFPADLKEKLNRDVRVANDANCFTLSEAVSGAARDGKVVFGVILGTGAGGGLVVDRKVLEGGNGICGEWGHNPLIRQSIVHPGEIVEQYQDRNCYCGRKNCVETFVSGTGFQNTYYLQTGKKLPAVDIYRAAHAGDKPSETVLKVFFQQLARNLAVIINIVDPDIIVVGGGLSNMSSLYEAVPELWRPYVFSDRITTRLLPATHGDSSGVIGAAWL